MNRALAILVPLVVAALLAATGMVAMRRWFHVERGVDLHEQDVHRLEARILQLETRAVIPPPAVRAELAPIAAEQLAACGARTEQLRWTLEVLIKAWPGRARLPAPPEGWPAWPEVGGMHRSAGDGSRGPITDALLSKLYGGSR